MRRRRRHSPGLFEGLVVGPVMLLFGLVGMATSCLLLLASFASRTLASRAAFVPSPVRSRYIPQNVRDEVFARHGGQCAFCGSTDDLQYDHVVAFSRGGGNGADNIQLLCGPCNRRKGVHFWRGF